jgi:hypothetical protein
MSDENPDKHDPIEAVRNGLGLFFRVAKTTIDRIPKRQFEEAVLSGAHRVGRTIERVTEAIDKRVYKPGLPAASASTAEPAAPLEPKARPEAQSPRDEPKG